MFVAQSTKGSPFINGLIVFILVMVAVLVTLMLVKLKKDPKDAEAQRFTLGLGKPKTT
jgi:heme/copper-type cytochrome/quinol oxidase subunit 2